MPLTALGCRQIWYYEPVGAHREADGGYQFRIDLDDVELWTWAPYVVAPWTRGDEDVVMSFRVRNRKESEMRIQSICFRVDDLRFRPFMVVEDKANGYTIPALGRSEYTLWLKFPEAVANIPRKFILCFDLSTPEGVQRKEIAYSY